jgi:uncharacterized protein (TIGR02145 family)
MLACVSLAIAFTQSFAKEKGSFTDPRDNKTYKTVKIGEQTWLAENLKFEAKDSKCYGEGGEVAAGYIEDNDGYIHSDKPTSTTTLIPAKIQTNCQKYGRLYNWETAKKVCPFGWHLPSDVEWNKLGGEEAGKYLKAKNGWNNFKSKSGNGEDIFGFSALPGGFGYSYSSYSYSSYPRGYLFLIDTNIPIEAQTQVAQETTVAAGTVFHYVGYSGFWWSATEHSSYDSNALFRYMSRSNANVGRDINDRKEYLYSVRCIKD